MSETTNSTQSPTGVPTGTQANRLLLLIPFGVAALLVLIYFLVWNWAAGVMTAKIGEWADSQRAAGLTVEHGDIDVEGFPFFLRARIETPLMANPSAGWRWSADFLYTDAAPLNPSRVILSPGGNQTLTLDREQGPEDWSLTSDVFRISLAETKTGFDLRGVQARPEGTSATGISQVEIASLIGNTLIVDNPDNDRPLDLGRLAFSGRDIVFDFANGTPGLALVEVDLSLAATGISTLRNRQSGESDAAAWQRGNGELFVEGMRLIIADGSQPIPTQLSANGMVHIDNQNYPAGSLELTLTDHLALLSVLNSHGLISRDEAEQADNALRFLSAAMGKEVTAPLKMRNGKLRLGPVAIMSLDKVD